MARSEDKIARDARQKDERGFTLLIALWAIAFLGIVAVAMSGDLLALRTSEAREEQAFRRDVAGRSALEITVARLWTKRLSGPDLVGFELVAVGDETFSVRVREEIGKLDLNTAPVPTLRRYLVQRDVEPDLASELAAQIDDWRDADDLVGVNGAEAPQYRVMGIETPPGNRPFERLEEVLQVPAMTVELFQQLRPGLTIYSGASAPDATVASPLATDGEGESEPIRQLLPTSPFGRAFEVSVAPSADAVSPPWAATYVIRLLDDPERPYEVLDFDPLAIGLMRQGL